MKGDRARALKLVFLFGCDPTEPVRRVVATRFVEVRTRRAGGKVFLTDKFRDPSGGPALDLTVRYLIGKRRLEGSAEAVVFVNKVACRDEVTFEAKLRAKRKGR